jgi:glycosyltransferase involved in cell wall biosynthesis
MNGREPETAPAQSSSRTTPGGPEISIVVPILDEEENLPALYRELSDVLQDYGRSYELLFIDDGSTDGSFRLLSSFSAADARVRVIRFRKNFGQTAALAAGFDYAKAPIIVTMDGDLQNDPRDIPTLVDRIEQGFDIVAGWRKERKDPFFSRRLPSQAANRLISFTTGVHLHDYGCTLKVFRSEVAKNIHLYGEMHRFIPAVASWMGVSIDERVVSHRPRQQGESKYGLSRTLRVLLDLLTVKFLLSYSSRPLQIFGSFGLLFGGVGFVLGCYLTWVKYGLGQPIGGRPLLLFAVLLMFTGLQLISLGLLGELLARLYHETRSRPPYAVREIISLSEEDSP